MGFAEAHNLAFVGEGFLLPKLTIAPTQSRMRLRWTRYQPSYCEMEFTEQAKPMLIVTTLRRRSTRRGSDLGPTGRRWADHSASATRLDRDPVGRRRRARVLPCRGVARPGSLRSAAAASGSDHRVLGLGRTKHPGRRLGNGKRRWPDPARDVACGRLGPPSDQPQRHRLARSPTRTVHAFSAATLPAGLRFGARGPRPADARIDSIRLRRERGPRRCHLLRCSRRRRASKGWLGAQPWLCCCGSSHRAWPTISPSPRPWRLLGSRHERPGHSEQTGHRSAGTVESFRRRVLGAGRRPCDDDCRAAAHTSTRWMDCRPSSASPAMLSGTRYGTTAWRK